MAEEALLQGACSCGRNQFHIHTPLGFDSLHVVFGEIDDQGNNGNICVFVSNLKYDSHTQVEHYLSVFHFHSFKAPLTHITLTKPTTPFDVSLHLEMLHIQSVTFVASVVLSLLFGAKKVEKKPNGSALASGA